MTIFAEVAKLLRKEKTSPFRRDIPSLEQTRALSGSAGLGRCDPDHSDLVIKSILDFHVICAFCQIADVHFKSSFACISDLVKRPQLISCGVGDPDLGRLKVIGCQLHRFFLTPDSRIHPNKHRTLFISSAVSVAKVGLNNEV